jgi:predicted nucleic acid-binding protein
MRFKIPYIASFDEDFDRVKGIKRIGHKKDLEILEEG